MAVVVHNAALTVSYSEMDGSPKESFGSGRNRAVRSLQCAWDDRITFKKELLGYRRWEGSDLHVHLPHQYPWVDNMWAMNVTPSPYGLMVSSGVTGQAAYEYAMLAVEYGVRLYNTDDEQESLTTNETLEPAVEFLTLSNQKLYWDTSQTEQLDLDQSPGIQVRMMEWVYSIEASDKMPANVLDLRGYVNNAAITSNRLQTTSGKLSFAAESLLFLGPRLGREIGGDDEEMWHTELRFMHRESGWNTFPYNTGTGISWQAIYNESGVQYKPYPQGDLSTLLIR